MWPIYKEMKQIGPTCGYYAISFVYNRSQYNRVTGKKLHDKAKDIIFNAHLNNRTNVGEIFSTSEVRDEWNRSGNSAWIATVEPISKFNNWRKSPDMDTYFIIASSRKANDNTPHFFVLYKKHKRGNIIMCWDSSKGYKIARKKWLTTLSENNSQLPTGFDMTDYFKKNKKPTDTFDRFRNKELTKKMIEMDEGARIHYANSNTILPVALRGECVMIHKSGNSITPNTTKHK